MRLLFIGLIILLTASASFAANIRGKVTSLKTIKDVNTSGFSNLERKRFEDSLVVSSGKGLANAIVYIENAHAQPARVSSPPGVKIDQKNSIFVPRVTAMMAGGEISVVNSDKIFHNVHIYFNGESLSIVNLPEYKQELQFSIAKKGFVSIKCEVHLDMQSYVLVLDTPYFAITDENGQYTMKDIAPGEYDIFSWHELLGKKKMKVIIKKDGLYTEANFRYDSIPTAAPQWY